MNYYIYMIVNKINNKKYIGKRKCKNDIEKDNYMGSGKILKLAFLKYGKENFDKIIIDICKNEKELDDREKYWIAFYKACESKEFYNIAEGGNGGNTYKGKTNKEIKAIGKKISINNSGDKHWTYKKGFTETHKMNISKNHADVSGMLNPRYNSIKTKCEFCNKDIYVSEYKMKIHKKHFCSRECFKKSLNYKGSNNPNAKKRILSIYGNIYEFNCINEAIFFLKENFNIKANKKAKGVYNYAKIKNK